MESREHDLTLERGWLGELAGRTRETEGIEALWQCLSRMGQTEVEFMDAQWPKETWS
jgi:hypothetical protein